MWIVEWEDSVGRIVCEDCDLRIGVGKGVGKGGGKNGVLGVVYYVFDYFVCCICYFDVVVCYFFLLFW